MVDDARDRLISEARLPYLTERERQTLARFLDRLEAAAGGRVQHVIFFGSKARGDAEPYSDIDLMVVADMDPAEVNALADDLTTDEGVPIMPLLWRPGEYQDLRQLKMPLYVNVRRDGVELWDPRLWREEEREVKMDFEEGTFRMPDEASQQVIVSYWREAQRSLSAMHDIQNLGYLDYALSRAYYAAFSALTAALYAVNVVRGKHSGLAAAMGEFLVKPGLIEAEYHTLYRQLMRGREFADYKKRDIEMSEAEMAALIPEAKRFVARIERFLEDHGFALPQEND